ncbi:MAG: asparaginase [Clostridiaceae bacterium]|nr:asparaginase [Clostridiaceae bacterium]
MKKRILIIGTGGTIASKKHPTGLRPELEIDDLIRLSGIPQDKCHIEGITIMNIDSTNMTPDRWIDMARCIQKNYENFDGFVITHGTDTMAYTGAALTYIFHNLNKPVIITGSQYPITEEYTDAIQNLTDAVYFAMENIKGVFICFDGSLIAGTRATKIKTKSYDAFESVNFPIVARIKHQKVQYDSRVLGQFLPDDETPPLEIRTSYNDRILVIKMIPGMHADIFDFIREHYDGVIIESFGLGGIPNNEYNIAGKINELVEAGIVVVLTTQCLEEGVEYGIYEVGSQLPQDKIIIAGDFNTETLVAKTMIAMGSFKTIEEIKEYIETPYTILPE